MSPDSIIQHSRARFSHESAKRLLREKYEAKMIFGYNGGMWQAGPKLQTTLLTCPDAEAVLLDLYENPIRVDTKELYRMSQQRWQEQMNAWLIEYEESRKQR